VQLYQASSHNLRSKFWWCTSFWCEQSR